MAEKRSREPSTSLSNEFDDRKRLYNLSSRKLYKCQICGINFGTVNDLNFHIDIKNHKKFFQCGSCQSYFEMYMDLLKHSKGHKENSRLQCDMCFHCYGSFVELHNHHFKHAVDKRFWCIYCDQKFETKGALLRHNVKHRKEEAHICSECSLEFYNYDNLRFHRTIHDPSGNVRPSQARTYACYLCPKKFESASKHSAHFKRAHDHELLSRINETIKDLEFSD